MKRRLVLLAIFGLLLTFPLACKNSKPSPTAPQSPLLIPTSTFTQQTFTPSPTDNLTRTPTPTNTPVYTGTATDTPTMTHTPMDTATATETPTGTYYTETPTETLSPTPIPTDTPAPPSTPTPACPRNYLLQWGGMGTGNGQMYGPGRIALNTGGDLFLVDSGNNRVQKFDLAGNFIWRMGANGGDGSFGFGGGEFNSPRGGAIGILGRLYVADYWAQRIQVFDNSGAFLFQWGITPDIGTFFRPNDVEADPSGNIYVSCIHRVIKFDSAGNYMLKWGKSMGAGVSGTGDGEFDNPSDIETDSLGNAYVADNNNNRIQKFDSSGNFILKWGKNGGDGTFGLGDGEFKGPAGLEVDSSDRVYVSDTQNHRIQEFNSTGGFLCKWGKNGGDGSFGSGVGEFYFPIGIAVDSLGNIYVVENSNHRIQKFTP